MKILVTGATGFIGAHSALALEAAGHDLRLLVRDPAKARRIAAAVGFAAADLVVGDVTDEPTVARAVVGCEGVLHAAGAVTLDRGRADEAMAVNVAGARNVLGAATDAGLGRIVHVSSTSALEVNAGSPLGVESAVASSGSGYAASKAAAEEVAREWQRQGAPVHITYPGGVIGPAAGEALGETSTSVARFVAGGVLPTSHASLSLVDVRDLAAVHERLFAPGDLPVRVMCGGTHLTMADLGSQLRRITGRRFPILPAPAWALRSVGRWADRIAAVSSIDPPLNEESMTLITTWPGTDDNVGALGVERCDIGATLAVAIGAWLFAGLLTPRQAGIGRSGR